MSKENIWCNNHNEFSELMKILDSKGYKWNSGASALEYDPYPRNGTTRSSRGVEIEFNTDNSTIKYGFSSDDADKDMSLTAFMIKEGIKMDNFTKANLEDGMIVKLRNVRYYMYFKKFNKFVRTEGHITLKEYNDDLCCVSDNEFDIVAVYNPTDLNSFDFNTRYLKLIWERPVEVVMTISEIEEKLGIKNLKVVKEKN